MVIKTEQNEKKITTIGILFALYISLITTINNNVVLYTGYVCLLGVLVIKLIFHNDYNMTISSYTKNYIWFALYCITSFFWAYDPSMTINHIPHMVACTILMVFMIDYFVKKKSVAPIYWTIAFVGVFMAVYVVVSYGGFKEFYNIATTEQHNFEAQRVGSAVTNVNIIGMQCGFAGIVLFYMAFIRKKSICYLLSLIPMLTSIASGSRKALLLIIGGIALVIYCRISKIDRGRIYIKIILSVIITFIVICLLMSLDIFSTAVGRFEQFMNLFRNAKEADGSSGVRAEMIIVGLKNYWNEPVLGYGLGNSRIINMSEMGMIAYSHNDYVELLLNGGLIGFIIYYGMIVALFKEYIKLMKSNPDNTDVRLSFYILILFLIMNFAAVTYYGNIMTYVYLILWISHLEIMKRN